MVAYLFLLLFIIHGISAQPPPSKWQTLNGSPPLVVARGGFSGIFPESSSYAYDSAKSASSLHNVVVLCDLQLTKDSIGICKSDLRLDNSTNIATIFPKRGNTYRVNGQAVRGWFSVDFTAEELFTNVALIQNIYSRPSIFDGVMPILTIDDVQGHKPAQLWLNVQYSSFYKEHKLDVLDFIKLTSQRIHYNFISSPEIDFLKNVDVSAMRKKPKLVFKFLDIGSIEPMTNKTYGNLLEDLEYIKTFASGILVQKEYIWPVDDNGYLAPATDIVEDAHGLGLEVYASGFANDVPGSYNNSYDPIQEYLQFIDNSDFSVDGVLTDFPYTASEAIACFANNQNKALSSEAQPLVITHNGASGIYPGSTDLAYKQAVEDGADIIDCSVQLSKDGISFCLDSADLSGSTTAMPKFMSKSTTIPEIQNNSGIFTFDLTWSEIQSLKPNLVSPYSSVGLVRNPVAKNMGKILKLAEFLSFAKNSTVPGVLINIQNAPYLASKKGVSMVDVVSTALANASYDEDRTKRVLIQSDDSSVLTEFKKINTRYERILLIPEQVGDAPKPAVDEIKKFATAVNVIRSSIMAYDGALISYFTNVTAEMQRSNISVYVSVLRNEFTTIAYDFFSDPVVEIATFVGGIGVNGLITEYPATARAYLRTPCSNLTLGFPTSRPYTILPVAAGGIKSLALPETLPPAQSPAPPLEPSDVVDPPLPDVVNQANPAQAQTPGSEPKASGQLSNVALNAYLCLLVVMLNFLC
ncbi:LOW QUALITY PROTEIN: glycerophosphodiester phosphodiesterase GDPDL7-like [Phalaenopsis equestris]|uniref:LOW QUALITY PROTEIN: glycerophosphodiester phosphodiesterase GDPDL7-like n=1 Tax=Phalaenopsis equestris TaxID=78828 RepID=UPI0009E61FF0|nr:LOW QUALITY PROTEIN: glycerophosphodiester phosphodiesterase GDPDL7-like [Phalaenopsis equestris]